MTKIKCFTYFYTDISHFYVLAASDKFISNKSAVETIKIENIE